MKKIIFISLLIVVVAVSAILITRQPRITRQPVIDDHLTTFFSISAIEQKSDETVFHMDAFHYPGYWVYLSKKAYLKGEKSGKIYKVIRTEGFELDTKVSMPENGNVPFKLYFEPVDKTETTLDFFDDDSLNEQMLAGIHLRNPERNEKIRCRIRGKVIDRPQSSRLILLRPGEDERVAKNTYIPIHNGTFEYDLYCNDIEQYQLCFVDELQKGSWMSVPFFAENGTVNLQLYPLERYDENRIDGGETNRLFNEFRDARDNATTYRKNRAEREQLEKENRYYTPAAQALIRELENAKEKAAKDSLQNEYMKLSSDDRLMLTPEAIAINDELQKSYRAEKEWEKQYTLQNNSIVTYTHAYQEIFNEITYKRDEEISEYVQRAKETFMPQYPDHPYTPRLKQLLITYDSIRIGGHYLDFSALDLDGNTHRLSEKINGKIALIDLWASWCGPCRRASKAMIPLYEKYKDRGFTIVGVAREKLNTQALEKALQEDKYPWLQLVELNDETGIWNLYGISNAAGGMWLVDKTGKILSYYPEPEEVEKILKEQL